MEILHSRTRDQYPLSPKKILKKTVTYSLGFWIIGAFALILIFTMLKEVPMSGGIAIFWLVSLGVMFALTLIIYLYQRWYFALYFYDLGEDFITIKKGPITPREITIPYERVQDVYVDQDIFDRIFGIYDVHLSSATVSSGMEAHIDGVDKLGAEGLRAELLTTVSQRISRRSTQVQPVPIVPAPAATGMNV